MAKEPTATAKDDQASAASPSPKQPTIQVRQPPSPDTKTIRTNDPITNQTEQQLAEQQEKQDQEAEQEAIKQQEEEAKKQQELFEQRQNLMVEIVKSPEGFVEVNEGNSEAIQESYREGYVYFSNVQSGPGGIEVKERAFLTDKGFSSLREHLGPSMGK